MNQLKTSPNPSEVPAANALEELSRMFAAARLRLKTDPSFFVVITELALRAKRDPAIERIGQQRDDFWVRRFSSIVERGIKEGIFRSDIDRDATAGALMVQMKGIAHHAAMRERTDAEIDSIFSGIEAQVEHWLLRPGGKRAVGKPSIRHRQSGNVGTKRLKKI